MWWAYMKISNFFFSAIRFVICWVHCFSFRVFWFSYEHCEQDMFFFLLKRLLLCLKSQTTKSFMATELRKSCKPEYKWVSKKESEPLFILPCTLYVPVKNAAWENGWSPWWVEQYVLFTVVWKWRVHWNFLENYWGIEAN